MNMKDINDNIITNRWEARYEKLSDDKKKKIDDLYNAEAAEYQLQVIKRKRTYPEIGDLFKINPKNEIFLYGVVINNHINNINGEEIGEPQILGVYSVATDTGIARKINRELIIAGII